MMKTRMSIETQNMDTGPAEQFQSWLGQKIKNYLHEIDNCTHQSHKKLELGFLGSSQN